jgi:hypothetical protein
LPATSREGRKPTSVDEVYEHVRQQFTEEEVDLLTAAVAAINCWNRHQAEGRETAALAH